MKTETWFRDLVDKYKDDSEFRAEGVILDITEKIVAKMEEKNISRAELARRLGVSKAFITKLLNGNTNLTLKTMVSVAAALGCELNIDICPHGAVVARTIYVTNSPEIDLTGFRKVTGRFGGEDSNACAA
jgi:transcriptional regulator with XRE-family HTH domain